MNKQPQITEQTRLNFIEAFISLNRTKPIERISVKEITTLTGNNRCTFYHYFKDIYDVLESIESEMIDEVSKIIKASYKDDSIDKTIVNAFVALYEKETDKLRIMLSSHNRHHFFEALTKNLIPVFSSTFPMGTMTAKKIYLFDAFFNGMLSILGRWLEHQDEIEIDELTQITRSYLDWLLAELQKS